MGNSSDEDDSRTALVGASRKSNPRSTRSTSNDSARPIKRQRKNPKDSDSGLGDIVPRGGSFSETVLPVDPDSTSSSGSSSDSGTSDSSDSDSNAQPGANPNAGNTAPAISWNQGRKAAVRTTLGKRSTPNATKTQFEAVNDKYWRSRSRSGSVSSANAEAEGEITKPNTTDRSEGELEEGEIDSKSESDDTDSLDSEADDSILLNIGDKMGMDGANYYDPATLALQNGASNAGAHVNGGSSRAKEEAFEQFARKYPTAPTCLADLLFKENPDVHDVEIQAKYVHFRNDLAGVDLRLPVVCIECQSEGHLADICPSKECTHCGAWNQHQSSTCPSWRRCQRCRERGHDEPKCESRLKGSASEVPCDYCGQEHLETECDQLWKDPTRAHHSEQVTVSICCANCCSAQHLVGDCKFGNASSKYLPSAFTLKDIHPDMITNLNTVRASQNAPPGSRKRHDWSPPSSSDEGDMMSRVSRGRGRGRPQPAPRGNSRGNIMFAAGAGSGRGDTRSRGPSRGRPPFPGNGRSNPPLPPGPPPPRGGGRGRGPSKGPRGAPRGAPRFPRGSGPGRGRAR